MGATELKFILSIVLISLANAKQIRISRFDAQVEEDNANNTDNKDNATNIARALNPAPYPAAGYTPERAFGLPDKQFANEIGDEAAYWGLTISPSVDSDETTTTTESYGLQTTTLYNEVPPDISNDANGSRANSGRAYIFPSENKTKTALAEDATIASDVADKASTTAKTNGSGASSRRAPYPAAGYRPSRAFLLPTENETKTATDEEATSTGDKTFVTAKDTKFTVDTKAPYPPSGYRLSREFQMPKISTVNQTLEKDNSNHPPCGSNDNPVAPKPVPGFNGEPDAERVLVTADIGPAVVAAPVLRSQPLVYRRPLLYPTSIETFE